MAENSNDDGSSDAGVKRIIYHDGRLLGWPDEWTTRNYNACNEPCDMLIGHCACGACHYPEDWADVLAYYNAELRQNSHVPTAAPTSNLTLSYF